MNLFILFEDPKKAAEAHLDKHVVKMVLEACQLLYTAHWIYAYPGLLENKSAIALSREQKKLNPPQSILTAPHSKTRLTEPGFRPVHIYHPCAIWVRQTIGNYLWAARLALALAEEYEYRWPGRGHHQCYEHAKWLLNNPPPLIPLKRQTTFVQAMEDRFKNPDPIIAYRAYYKISKGDERNIWKYTRRPPPQF